MTDKDMLERAAMAGGLIPLQWVDSGWLCETQDSSPRFIWNSLDSSADAFELALDLGIGLRHNQGWSETLHPDTGPIAYMHEGNKRAATRRAITRAAAAMAK